jgi:hypothetical protein
VTWPGPARYAPRRAARTGGAPCAAARRPATAARTAARDGRPRLATRILTRVLACRDRHAATASQPACRPVRADATAPVARARASCRSPPAMATRPAAASAHEANGGGATHIASSAAASAAASSAGSGGGEPSTSDLASPASAGTRIWISAVPLARSAASSNAARPCWRRPSWRGQLAEDRLVEPRRCGGTRLGERVEQVVAAGAAPAERRTGQVHQRRPARRQTMDQETEIDVRYAVRVWTPA